MLLLRPCAHPVDVLRGALVDAPGIDGAFVFGSTARGDTRDGSDVDVLLVGDEDAQLHAGRLLAEASFLLERELDVVAYDRDELSRRMASGNAFIRRVLDGPKEWVRGDAVVLEPVEGGMNPRLQVVLDSRPIEAHPGGRRGGAGNGGQAVRSLRSSRVAGLDPDSAFTLAYQGTLHASTAIIRSAGYRVRGEDTIITRSPRRPRWAWGSSRRPHAT